MLRKLPVHATPSMLPQWFRAYRFTITITLPEIVMVVDGMAPECHICLHLKSTYHNVSSLYIIRIILLTPMDL